MTALNYLGPFWGGDEWCIKLLRPADIDNAAVLLTWLATIEFKQEVREVDVIYHFFSLCVFARLATSGAKNARCAKPKT